MKHKYNIFLQVWSPIDDHYHFSLVESVVTTFDSAWMLVMQMNKLGGVPVDADGNICSLVSEFFVFNDVEVKRPNMTLDFAEFYK